MGLSVGNLSLCVNKKVASSSVGLSLLAWIGYRQPDTEALLPPSDMAIEP